VQTNNKEGHTEREKTKCKHTRSSTPR